VVVVVGTTQQTDQQQAVVEEVLGAKTQAAAQVLLIKVMLVVLATTQVFSGLAVLVAVLVGLEETEYLGFLALVALVWHRVLLAPLLQGLQAVLVDHGEAAKHLAQLLAVEVLEAQVQWLEVTARQIQAVAAVVEVKIGQAALVDQEWLFSNTPIHGLSLTPEVD